MKSRCGNLRIFAPMPPVGLAGWGSAAAANTFRAGGLWAAHRQDRGRQTTASCRDLPRFGGANPNPLAAIATMIICMENRGWVVRAN